MPPKLVNVVPGEIHAIPLFVLDKPVLTRFSKKDWQRDAAEFAFMRVVEDRAGSGIIIEVFELLGTLSTPVAEIVRAKLLFRPIPITGLEIHKKRWPRVGQQVGYDRERDSSYSQICLVMSATDNPVLWKGGVKTPIGLSEVGKYEPMTLWSAVQVERRIIESLAARSGTSPKH